MNYLLLFLNSLAIAFLYYKVYSKPKATIAKLQPLPRGFHAKATPVSPAQKPQTPTIPFRRSSYNTPKR
jgi:hypothetical protein